MKGWGTGGLTGGVWEDIHTHWSHFVVISATRRSRGTAHGTENGDRDGNG